MNSADFVGGMERLDSTWRPTKVVIDPKLIDDVCGAVAAGGAGSP